jgi:hypothetical protein
MQLPALVARLEHVWTCHIEVSLVEGCQNMSSLAKKRNRERDEVVRVREPGPTISIEYSALAMATMQTISGKHDVNTPQDWFVGLYAAQNYYRVRCHGVSAS